MRNEDIFNLCLPDPSPYSRAPYSRLSIATRPRYEPKVTDSNWSILIDNISDVLYNQTVVLTDFLVKTGSWTVCTGGGTIRKMKTVRWWTDRMWAKNVRYRREDRSKFVNFTWLIPEMRGKNLRAVCVSCLSSEMNANLNIWRTYCAGWLLGMLRARIVSINQSINQSPLLEHTYLREMNNLCCPR